jgi:hypothetical protein
MATIAREHLLDACRTVYSAAQGDFMLPPLIRDAATLEAKSGRTICTATVAHSIRFEVELDWLYIGIAKFPLMRLPLQFKIELHDRTAKNALELTEAERRELMKAFLLGANAPILVERNTLTEIYKVYIQFSSTYFVECGSLDFEGRNVTFETVCDEVGHCLYETTKEFFVNSQEGVGAWSARAAQDLFGEPRPAASRFWPLPLQELHVPSPGEINVPVLNRERSRLVECLPAPFLLGSVAQDRLRLPVLSVAGRTSALRSSGRGRTLGAVAASVLVAGFGLMMAYHFSGDVVRSELPQTAATIGSTTLAAENQTFTEARLAKQVFVTDTPKAVVAPPSVQNMRADVAEATDIKKSADIVGRRPTLVAKAAEIDGHKAISATRRDRMNNGRTGNLPDGFQVNKNAGRKLYGSSTNRDVGNPLMVAGRAIESVASAVATNLQQVAFRFSSLLGDKRLRRHNRTHSTERS